MTDSGVQLVGSDGGAPGGHGYLLRESRRMRSPRVLPTYDGVCDSGWSVLPEMTSFSSCIGRGSEQVGTGPRTRDPRGADLKDARRAFGGSPSRWRVPFAHVAPGTRG
jgi:hypothetical protein